MKLKFNLLATLIELAKLGALEGKVEVRELELGRRLSLAQQTISSHIIALERAGLIVRNRAGKKTYIGISAEGMQALLGTFLDLAKTLAFNATELIIRGKVLTGMREGSYYMKLNGYVRQFQSKLGISPYPGTLNVRLLSGRDVIRKELLFSFPGIRIDEWSDDTRTYGGLTCYPVAVVFKDKEVPAFLCNIDRSHYDATVAELISSYHLRASLQLTDGDIISILAKIEFG
jgi:riboflavin kinase